MERGKKDLANLNSMLKLAENDLRLRKMYKRDLFNKVIKHGYYLNDFLCALLGSGSPFMATPPAA